MLFVSGILHLCCMTYLACRFDLFGFVVELFALCGHNRYACHPGDSRHDVRVWLFRSRGCRAYGYGSFPGDLDVS